MTIKKGTIIRETKVNTNEELNEYNRVIDYVVTKVNQKSYTVDCLTYKYGCKIMKEAVGKTYRNIYGTETTYTVVS